MDLVTGGCGFIGQHLVKALRQRGAKVRVLDLRPWKGSKEGIESIQGSILDRKDIERAMDGCERVFHLAANPNLWAADKTEFERVNHQGTRLMLKIAAEMKPHRFIYTSTESILKSRYAKGDAKIDESVRLSLEDMPGPYCRSKFLAEEAAHEAFDSGLPVVIVNPTMPLGPEDTLLTPPTKMILGFIQGKIPAYLNCEFNLVDARDAAIGHILAAEQGRLGERYILGGVNIRLSALLKELEELTNIKMPKFKIPYGIALISALVSEALANVTHRPPMAPLTGVRLARSSLAFDCRKAHQELSWKPRELTETLKDTLSWFNQSGLTTPFLFR